MYLWCFNFNYTWTLNEIREIEQNLRISMYFRCIFAKFSYFYAFRINFLYSIYIEFSFQTKLGSQARFMYRFRMAIQTKREVSCSVYWRILWISTIIQGYPQKMRLQRRLYGIRLVRFLAFRVPCRPKLPYFCAWSIKNTIKILN